MINYANDINVYRIYANMAMFNEGQYETERPYFCVYTGKRDYISYKNSMADVYKKYGQSICMHERMPSILGSAMGDEAYIARFRTEEEVQAFMKFVYERKPSVEHTVEEVPDPKKKKAKKK